jgi:two-component system sensor histidine kinase BaeS
MMLMMKSLKAKILLALIASTVFALLLTTVLSRVALKRGFVGFLQQQEEQQLHNMVPELASYFEDAGSWDGLYREPREWMRLLSRTRPEGVRPPERVPPEFRPGPRERRSGPPGERRPGIQGEPGPGPREVRQLWRRVFLVDQDKQWVAGARTSELDSRRLVAVEVDGLTVGWIGFREVKEATTPEAIRFLAYQNRALVLSLLIALGLASLLGFFLARSISRPVGRLRDTVEELTAGEFNARAKVGSRDEIGVLSRHVNRLAETLEKNESARRRWTADIAHELRTPLSVLQGELEAIKDGIRPLSDQTILSLAEEVSHLVELVEDLQQLALADAGALNLEKLNIDLVSLTRQILDSYQERIAASGLNLITQLPDELSLRADPQRLRQLLHNLLENACRYTDKGGSIRFSLRLDSDFAVLEMEDSAPGVTPEQQDQLFERFYRGEVSRGRKHGGSGLGLAICRNIVEAHGGEIAAEPRTLGGLRIRVRFPRGI